MSVVIIGGNECMENQYKQICKQYNCKAKVYNNVRGKFKNQIGKPDVIILFTATVSHKMVVCAVNEAQKHDIVLERCHSSSSSALKKILENYC